MTSTTPLDPATLADAVAELSARDPDLARIVQQHGVPPLWDREPGFPTLLLIILEQQVSLASARATYNKLLAVASPLTPVSFLELDDAALRAIGFSRQKTSYGRALASDIVEARFDLDALTSMSDDEARTALIKRKGIGPWTAEIYLLMVLRRPDTWPTGDLALQIAAHEVKGLDSRPTAAEMAELGKAWRPWRAVAARLLWQYYLERRTSRRQPR